MAILAIDTATPVVGAAFSDRHTNEMWSKYLPRGADAELFPAIEKLVDGREVDLVAVSVGPGAFTGLRVGVSIALGFAVARQIPVVAVSSLAVRAMLVGKSNTLALLDARKKRVYAQLFDASSSPIALNEAADISIEAALPKEPFWAVGQGAILYKDIIEAAGGRVCADAERSPALTVARLGEIFRDRAVEPGEIALKYLRPPDAKPPKNVGVPIGSPHHDHPT